MEAEANAKADLYTIWNSWGVCGLGAEPEPWIEEAYTSNICGLRSWQGQRVWLRGNIRSKNQIMAIKVPEDRAGESLQACAEEMLAHRGISGGQWVWEADTLAGDLQAALGRDWQVLDFAQAHLEAMLYYLDEDRPVLALAQDGEAVLLTGFNEYNVVVWRPSDGSLEKMGKKDATAWLAPEGGRFLTYIPGSLG